MFQRRWSKNNRDWTARVFLISMLMVRLNRSGSRAIYLKTYHLHRRIPPVNASTYALHSQFHLHVIAACILCSDTTATIKMEEIQACLDEFHHQESRMEMYEVMTKRFLNAIKVGRAYTRVAKLLPHRLTTSGGSSSKKVVVVVKYYY